MACACMAIIDSRSVKTVSKGGSADMTQAKESKGASAILPQTQNQLLS